MKKRRNCEGDPERKDFQFLFHNKDPRNTLIHQCPISYMDPEMEWYFDQFAMSQLLEMPPYSGGFMDMPNKMVEAFSVINEAIRWDAKKKEDKKKAKARKEQAELEALKRRMGHKHGRHRKR